MFSQANNFYVNIRCHTDRNMLTKSRMGWQKRESARLDLHDRIAVNRKLYSLSGCVVSQQTVS